MKINRKGFTLVELLVTIAICAIIVLLMTYGIIGAINSSKDKSIKISEKSIKEAANAYSLEQGEDVWKESSSYNFKALCVTVGELMNKGFLDEKAAISEKNVNKDTFVIVKKNKVTLAIEKEEIIYDNNSQNYTVCTGNNIVENETVTRPSITGYEKYTDRIELSFQNGTAQSGVNNYKCLYGETSSSINREGIVEGNKCVLDNLKNNTEYYVYVYMNTNKGSSVTATGNTNYKTSDLKAPTSSQNLNIITIRYNDKDSNNKAVNSPTHYVYSNISGVSNKAVSKCVMERGKLNCIGTTSIIEKNTWYKVNEDNISITYPEEDNTIKIKARIYDKSNNYKETEKEYIIDKHTVKFYKNTALDIEGSKKDYVTRSCITNGTGTCNVISPNITPNIGYSIVGWNKNKNATTSEWNVNTTKAINSDLTYYAITRINKIYVKFNVNSGVVKDKTTASNGTVYNWKSDTNGIISRTVNNNTITNLHTFEYGKAIGSDGLANWDNNSYLYISRVGYIAVDGQEWKCLSGDCTVNTTYSDSTNYQSSALCDASYRDCTVNLGVNWTLKTYNFTITSGVGGSLKVDNTTRNNSITVNSGETKTLKVYHFDKIKVTATPNKEYQLTSLKHGSTSMNSGATFEVSGLETISATWADIVAPKPPTYKAYFQDGSGTYTSGEWTNKGVYTTISSTDEGSGVTQIQYSKDNQKTWTKLNLGGKEITKDGITYSGNESWTVYDGRQDTVYFKACDAFNNCSPSSNAFVIRYDTSKPSVPTYKAYFSDGSGNYTSGSWTNKQVYTEISSSDSHSGVSYIQYSKDKSSWTTFKFTVSGGLKITDKTASGIEVWDKYYREDTFYFRACDKLNQCSAPSNAYTIRYDVDAPSQPTLTTIYDIWGSQSYTVSSGYSKDYGIDGTWVTSTNDPYIMFNDLKQFTGIKGVYIELENALNSDLSIQIFYETSTAGYNETHSSRGAMLKGKTKLYIPFTHTGNWTKVRFDIGSASGISYKIKSLGVAADPNQWNKDDIILHGVSSDSHSGINNWQYTYSSSATSVGSNSSSTWVKYGSSSMNEFIMPPFTAERNQYTYVRTCDNVGNCSSKSNTYIKIDKTVPSKAEIVSNSETSLTLNYADNFGVVSYYFGKDNPSTKTVTYTGITSKTSGSINTTISSAGTYYFSVKDAAGNVTTSSITSNTLTVNPNGGTYNGKTSNSSFIGVYDSSKNVGVPTPPSGYNVTFNGNGGTSASASLSSTKSFSNWVLSGNGQYVSGSNPSVSSEITRTTPVEDGETYDRFVYNVSGITSDKWLSIRYPSYTYTSGHKYEIKLKARVNNYSGATFTLRHAAFANDYGSPGLATHNLSSSYNNWTNISMTRTMSGTTTTLGSTTKTIAPVFEGYTGNIKNTTSKATIDIKDLLIIDRTTDKLLLSNSNSYLYRSGDGTLTANYTNNSITLPNATRTGYTFNGWYTAATGGTKIGNAGAKYTPTANTTLYAQWTPNKYTVTLNNQSPTIAGTTSVTATYDSAMPSIIIPRKVGNSFIGYYTSQSAINMATSVDKGAPVRRINLNIANNNWQYTTAGDKGTHIQLIVKVVDSSLTTPPSLDFNDVGLTIDTQYKVTGSNGNWTYYIDFDITESMVSKRGNYSYDKDYRFIDINNVKSSTTVTISLATKGGKKYYNSDGTSAWNYDKASNTTLYAKYSPYTYNLSYNYNSGSVSTANKTTYNSSEATFTLTNPTRAGYTFNGYTEKISTTNWYSGFINIDTGKLEKNTTYPNSVYSELIYLESGVKYTLSGTNLGGIRWRFFKTDGTYVGSTSGSTFTPSQNGYVHILLYEGCTEANRKSAVITSSQGTSVPITKGSTGNRNYTANFIDQTPPTTPTYKAYFQDGSGTYTSGNWTNKDVATTISSTDAGSGVTTIQYSKDNKKTWSTLSLGGNGITKNGSTYSGNESWTLYDGRNDTIYFRACDAAGNCSEASNAYNIKYDVSAPTVPTYKAYFKDGSGTYTSGNWTNKQVYTDISATDSYSGVSYMQYSKDKQTWTTFTFSVSGGLKTSGTTSTGTEPWGTISGRNDTFYFRACDKLNQCSNASASYNIKYDLDAPSTPTLTTLYDIWGSQTYKVSGYSKDYGTEGTWTTSTNDPIIDFNNLESFTGINGAYIEFASALSSNITVQIFYETSTTGYNETHSVKNITIPKGTIQKYIPFNHTGNWTKVRFDIGDGNSIGISYKIKSLAVSANPNQWNKDDILLYGKSSDSHSGINNWQFTFSSSATAVGSDSTSSWVKYGSSATTEFINSSNRFEVERNQLVYIRTCDNVGNCNKGSNTYIRVDKTAPSKAQIVINSETSLTLNYADNYGVVGYYFGNTNPSTTNVTYTSITSSKSGSINKTISSAGTYYFSVKDAAGNVKTSTITSYTLTVNPNGGTYNSKTSNSTFVGVTGSSKNVGVSTPPADYKVTFNGNGGTSSSASLSSKRTFSRWVLTGGGTYNNDTKVYTFGSSAGTLTANYVNSSVTLPSATRTGYTFSGWYTAATGGTKIGNAGAKYTPTSNITLYAQWTANKYTVTLNNQGATSAGTTSVTATYNSTMPSITKPSKTGHTFNGYYDSTTAIDMASSISKWSSTIRISLAEAANNWKYTTAGDKGTHIQLIVSVVDSSLTAAPKLEFNDVTLTNNSQYKVTGSTGNWTYYIDLDITENMVSNRNGTPYDTVYRFIDLENVKSSTTVTVSLATKGGKKYYNNAGSSAWDYDKTSNTTLYAKWTPNNYTVTYNSNNLAYGLENKSETTSGNMKYKVSNGVITVTANKDDGYGFVNVRAYLEANKEYIFSCTTNGTWGSGNDTVEAFLMLEGQYNTYYRMGSNNGHKFTPTVTGEYWLRLDVNKTGKTYTFSNINISTNISSKTVTYNGTYGTLPTTSRSGYTFNGWYTASSGGTKLSSTTKVTTAGNHTVYAHWTANNYTITYDFQNNIYNHNTSDWTFNGSSKVNTSYKYNNTPGFEVYSNTSQYTGIRIPINSDKKTNTNYKLSLYAYRTGNFSGNLRAYATTYNSSNTVLSYNHKFSINTSNLTANKWTNYTGTFNTGSYSKWDTIYIDYDTANQGPVYISDIRLDEYSTVTKNFGLQLGTLPTPKRSGYTFGGWYTGVNGTGTKVSSETTTPVSNTTYYAKWTPNNYTVTYNTNNLIYGLENVSQTTTSRVKYSVSSGKVSMTALVNDGYEYVGGRAYLEAGKTYYFSGTSEGTWGSDVEAFVMLNKSTATGDFVTITSLPYSSNDNAYPFTVQKTGEYWLRLDVNASGKTYTFSNIRITNNVSTSNVTFGNTYGTQPTISRTGHTFNGWYTAVSGGKKVTSSTIVQTASNHTLYAQWTTNNYTVTYNYSTNGGTSATKTSATVSYGNSIDLTPTATKSGWTFVGWNTNKDATSGLSSLKMSSSNVTLYAIYRKEAITYTATTRANVSGTTGSNKTLTCTIAAVYNNSTQGTSCEVTLPSNPYTYSGWTFNGWVTTASNTVTTTNTSGTAAGNKITLTKNVNIVATWKKSASANFYYYNGSAQAKATATCTMYNGASSCNYTVPSAVTSSSGPSSTTYKGVSTSTSSTGTTSSYTSINSNYYAVYQNSITSTFYYSGLASDSYTYTTTARTATASGTRTATTNGTSYSVNNPTISIPSAVTSSTGGAAAQTYKGVSTSTSSTTTMTPTTANAKYYAVYTENLDFYYYNGSSHTKTSSVRRMLYNGTNYTITLSTSVPSPSAYSGASFIAWSYTSGSSNSSYYREPLQTGVNALYAVYQKTVTLSYNANGGTGAPSSQSGTLYYTNTSSNTISQTNPTITLSSTKPTKTGYTFSGWNTNQNGTGTQYNSASSYTLSGSTTLYANWAPSGSTMYTVKHWQQKIDASTTQNSTNYELVKTETFYGTTASSITPTVHTYTGFNSPSSKSATINANGTTVVDYYYTRKSFTVTLNKGTGISSVIGAGSYQYGKSVTIEATISAGYTWSNWNGTYNTTTNKYTFNMPASNVNNTANGTPITYTITLDPQGANSNGTTKAYYQYNTTKKVNGVDCIYYTDSSLNTCLTRITNPTKTGYTFGGYYTSTNGSGTQCINASGSFISEIYKTIGNRTLYAKWTANSYNITYNFDGGTKGTYAPATATYNNVIRISNPKKEGHIFEGWTFNGTTSTAKYGTNSSSVTTSWSNPSTKVTAEYFQNLTSANGTTVTLTANWKQEVYTITYDLNGGSGTTIPPATKTYSNALTLTTIIPEREGYIFLGWSEDKNATHSTYASGGTYTDNKSTTLYAVWQLAAHEHRWDARGIKVFDQYYLMPTFTCGYQHQYSYASYCSICGMSKPYYKDHIGDIAQTMWCPCKSTPGTYFDDRNLTWSQVEDWGGVTKGGSMLNKVTYEFSVSDPTLYKCSEHK